MHLVRMLVPVGLGVLLLCFLEVTITIKNTRIGLLMPLLTAIVIFVLPRFFSVFSMFSLLSPFVLVLLLIHFITRMLMKRYEKMHPPEDDIYHYTE